jgi:cephalosporin hydroxylase
MKTVDVVKDRYGRAKNMLVQSRRGLAWGRDALANQGPLPQRTEMTDLEAYVEAHETGRGIWKWEHYLPIYERHFEKFRGREVHVVEIGVYSGGSLDMWKEYFGPKSHIYGVDIGPECKAYERPGIDIFIGDQADPVLWKRFLSQVPQVDVVIDDGGHQMFQQIATLEALLPHIRPGGVYVCEDVHGEYNPFLDYVFGLSRGLHARPVGARAMKGTPPTDMQLALDSFHFYPFVTVIEKRADRVDQLIAPKRGTEWDPTHVGRGRA